MDDTALRKAKILWSKSGKGSDTTRLTLPVSWIRDMDLNKDIRQVELKYNKETKEIIIKKLDSQ